LKAGRRLAYFKTEKLSKFYALEKKRGGHIGWKELVILFDLTEQQAEMLQATIQISE
jgi:hypothetical protein